MVGDYPLKDIRVLDLSRGIAGPSCGALFAEYGAEVIKVEPPQGDWMRHLGPGFSDRSAGFIYYNRAKRSLALDIKAPGSVDVVLDLASRADVLIDNNRPGVSDRLGIGFEAIKARQPRIVYVAVSGLGLCGPGARRPLSDTVAQALSGLMQINRGRADAPCRVDTPIVDSVTGLYAFQAAVMALWGDPAKREARLVDVSLLQSAAAIQGFKILEYGVVGQMPKKLNSPAGSYPTADGWFAVTLVREDHWQGICRAIQRADLASDARFTSFADRDRNSQALTEILDAVFRARTTAEWVQAMTAEGVLAAPIQDYGDWMADEQTVASAGAPLCAVTETESAPVPRTPGRRSLEALSPRLGQHSLEVLRELGYSTDAIEALIAGGAVKTSSVHD